MLTFLIVGESTINNREIARSIIGIDNMDTCVICLHSPIEALKVAIDRKYHIDLFIISIKMKEQGGYRLAEKIRKITTYKNTPILFVTGLTYNLAGFEELTTFESYKKYNYISLPISSLDVQGKCGLYLDSIIKKQEETTKTERVIYFKHSKGEVLVDVKDLLFAEVQGKNCQIHTKINVYLLNRHTLQQVIDIVDDYSFARCHKSFAVNIKQIKALEKKDKRIWLATFGKGESCDISKTYIQDISNRYKGTFQDK